MSRIGNQKLRTITIGTCLSIQGEFVRSCTDGTIIVRVGTRLFRGLPVDHHAAPPAAA